MAFSSTLKFTTEFQDGTSRNLTIGPIATSAISVNTLRTKVQNFNTTATRQSLYPNFDTAFVSSDGSSFSKISAAEIITTQRTYFNL